MFSRVELNLTELCDLRCSFCPRAFDYPNRNLHMTLETAEIIADQVSMIDRPIEVILSGRGEPTLHNQFGELVELFLDRDIDLIMFTNGKRLDRYYDLVTDFKRLSYDVYSENEEDFYSAIEKTNHLKCRRSIVQKTEDGKIINRFEKGEIHSNLDQEFVENRAGAIKDGFNFKYKGNCPWLRHVVFIDWNGNYNLCCKDWTPTIMGNVRDESLLDYYNKNTKLKEYQQGISSGKRLSPCDVCTY